MAREFGSDFPEEQGVWHDFHEDVAKPDGASGESGDDGGSGWETVIDLGHEIRDETRGLDQIHWAAAELDDFITSYMGVRPRTDDPAWVVPVIAEARDFLTVLDEADLPGDRLRPLEPLIDLLATELGADLARADAAGPQPPKWLDVASPAHGRVNVSGVLTAFSKGHVTTADSATVVTANDCTLEAEEHYHVRRVSLDCSSLFVDDKAMEAFVYAMLDPSSSNISRLLDRLERLIDPPRDAETQLYHYRLPADVSTHTERSAAVVMGTGSTAHTTSNYHVRETVVPLDELLLRHPDLIYDLAMRRDGDTLGEPLLAALGQVEDPVLLRNARSLPPVQTSVSHSLGGTRVRLANAVMVGYGNTLTATSEVQRGQSRLTNLSRLDREVQRTKNAMREWPEPPQPPDMPPQREPSSSSPPLPEPRFPLLFMSPTQPAEEGKKRHNFLPDINDKLGLTEDRNMRRDADIDGPNSGF
ncbi:hypothetical protein [Micromonospora sp. NPDC093244]|uniref:hypothetical protein n=1 Tax=Micromonospora sp. NPDC093244 TaxID=3155071 RepID=UPI0034182D4E